MGKGPGIYRPEWNSREFQIQKVDGVSHYQQEIQPKAEGEQRWEQYSDLPPCGGSTANNTDNFTGCTNDRHDKHISLNFEPLL